jgi:hypothetical protein
MKINRTTFVYNTSTKSALGDEMVGQSYNRLTVVKNLGFIYSTRGCKIYLVETVCTCGNHVVLPIGRIRNGNTKSCGCLAREVTSNRSTTHGHKNRSKYGENGSNLYFVWIGVKQRCLNKNHKAYHRYGGRGIRICDRWRHSFQNFLADMGATYKPTLTLDRIDNNKDYCPDNCRWATSKEQSNNMSSNHIVEFRGKKMTLTQAAEMCNMRPDLVNSRINTHGWDVERALTQRRQIQNKKNHLKK